MKNKLCSLLLLATLAPWPLLAAESASGLAFPEVQEAGGARAIGMGSTYVGVAEGSASLLWNPAGLGHLSGSEFSLNHKIGFLDSYQDIALLSLPLTAHSGLGMGVNYSDNGTFEGRDNRGVLTNGFTARTYGANLGWGMSGPAGLAWGLGIKADHQDLADKAYDAIAGDVGLLWTLAPSLTLGAAYTNFGPTVEGRNLASGLRLGLSSYLGRGSDFQWLLAVSGETLTSNDNSVHIGLEHTLFQMLALRAGYAFSVPSAETDGLQGWTFGGGVLLKQLSLDYAYVPLGTLGATHRLSLTYAFAPTRPL